MGGPGSRALFSCCLIFVCLCLTKLFSPYVGALDVSMDILEDDCVPDISDMVDYDPVTQTSSRCEKWKREKQKAKAQCQGNLEDALQKLEACLMATYHKPCDCPPPTECPEDVKPTPCHNAEDMFFRRLVRHFTNVIQQKAPENGHVEAQIGVHLSSHDWKKLQSYADGKGDYRRADIHDVMVGMTMNIFYFNQTSVVEWLGEQINLRSPAVILLSVSVTVIFLVFGVGMFSDVYWNQRFMACLLTSIFVISLIWNWIYLYQEETIKRYRNAQKYEDIPANCMPHKMTWLQGLQEWFSSRTSVHTDHCFEYHKIYQVDPLFDIPPTRALSFTVSSMFVDPCKYIGRAVSEFHAEIFRDLPIWAALPALFSCYVFGFFALYAYIAAPRRVLREQPRHQVRRERLGAAQERNLPIAQPPEEDPPHPQDGDRIENVPLPSLPAVKQKKRQPPKQQGSHQNPSHGKQEPHQGAARDLTQDQRCLPRGEEGQDESKGYGPQGQELCPGVNKPGDDSLQQRQQQQRDCGAGPSGLGPAVRPKIRTPPAQTFQRPADGNDADSRSLDSETVLSRPRPRDLGESSPSGQKTLLKKTSSVGDSESGTQVSHPASERSDGESLMGSWSGSISMEKEASMSHSGDTQKETSCIATGNTTPSSLGSPDDISVISQSPENTNSATYDFISTSSFGLSGEQPRGSVSEVLQDGLEEEDSEDDFVVLKTER